MSQPGDAFTLLESGTTRLHFKLAKALEDASSSRQQDDIVLDTVAQIRAQLASRSFSGDVSKLSSALLTLLHCLYHYPSSAAPISSAPRSMDVSFALLPTLQLLSLAADWKHLLLAHQLLPFLLPLTTSATRPVSVETVTAEAASEHWLETGSQSSASASTSSRPASSVARGQLTHRISASASHPGDGPHSATIPSQSIDDSSSLLLLNTFRANLTAAADQAQLASHPSTSRSSSRSRSGSPSASRSPTRIKSIRTPLQDAATVRKRFRTLASLRSLASGIPQGPAVLPSLASTLVALTRHPDSSIRSMTLNAMLKCASFTDGNQTDRDGQIEMLDAALTIVRLTLASTYAFSPGADLEEQQGMIVSEMERRVDSDPTVLRSCMRLVEHVRSTGLISWQEAACHAIEALQASRWAPMHLEIPSLQQQRITPTVIGRTEGIRAQTAARQRASLHTDHDYHGTYAPWLVEACLSSLTRSTSSIPETTSALVYEATSKELLATVLRIYNVASQGKAAALAICVSSARCIGALYQSAPWMLSSAAGPDGEMVALWSTVAAHIKSQLRSTNPNRKTAALLLLEALLPVGWAQSAAERRQEQTQDDGEDPIPSSSPLRMSEPEFEQLMALLADPDVSIRKRVVSLLHQVDPGLTALLPAQIETTVDSERPSTSGRSETDDGPSRPEDRRHPSRKLLYLEFS